MVIKIIIKIILLFCEFREFECFVLLMFSYHSQKLEENRKLVRIVQPEREREGISSQRVQVVERMRALFEQ